MTWKQLRSLVSSALDSHSIDIEAQPIHIRYCNIMQDHTRLNIEVFTGGMPQRCTITIRGIGSDQE